MAYAATVAAPRASARSCCSPTCATTPPIRCPPAAAASSAASGEQRCCSRPAAASSSPLHRQTCTIGGGAAVAAFSSASAVTPPQAATSAAATAAAATELQPPTLPAAAPPLAQQQQQQQYGSTAAAAATTASSLPCSFSSPVSSPLFPTADVLQRPPEPAAAAEKPETGKSTAATLFSSPAPAVREDEEGAAAAEACKLEYMGSGAAAAAEDREEEAAAAAEACTMESTCSSAAAGAIGGDGSGGGRRVGGVRAVAAHEARLCVSECTAKEGKRGSAADISSACLADEGGRSRRCSSSNNGSNSSSRPEVSSWKLGAAEAASSIATVAAGSTMPLEGEIIRSHDSSSCCSSCFSCSSSTSRGFPRGSRSSPTVSASPAAAADASSTASAAARAPTTPVSAAADCASCVAYVAAGAPPAAAGAAAAGLQPSSPPEGASGSPFFRMFLSPLCDFICSRYIPQRVSPDLLSFLALCFATAAAGCTWYCCTSTTAAAARRAARAAAAAAEETAAAFTPPGGTLPSSAAEDFSVAAAAATTEPTWLFAVAGALWMLYSLFDNLDGKQARRLRRCTAGGDFLDHSGDSIVASLSGVVVLQSLLSRPPAAASAAAGSRPRKPASSLFFSALARRMTSSGDFLLGEWWWPAPASEPAATAGGAAAVEEAAAAADLISLAPLDCVVFLLLSQIPFFISTWAHPIVGRTILSSALEGCNAFSVDEVNFLVIPGLLFVRAFFPRFWSKPAAATLLPLLPSPCAALLQPLLHLLQMLFQVQQDELTLGVLVLFATASHSFIESARLLSALTSWRHVPRLLPGVCLFAASLVFKPPVLLQLGVFSLLCLEMIAARLKLHVRTQLYQWWPVALYAVFLLTLPLSWLGPPAAGGAALGSFADAAAAAADASSSPFSQQEEGTLKTLREFFRVWYTPDTAAAATLVLLAVCLFAYKHIINRRNSTAAVCSATAEGKKIAHAAVVGNRPKEA